jgi:hypothetical protein
LAYPLFLADQLNLDDKEHYLAGEENSMKYALAFMTSLALFQWKVAAVDKGSNDRVPRIGEPPLVVQARLEKFSGHTVSFSSDGRRLLTDNFDGAQVWDADGFRPIGKSLAIGGSIDLAHFVASSSLVFVKWHPNPAVFGAHARYFDATTGATAGPDMDFEKSIDLAVSSRDGKFVAYTADVKRDGKVVSDIRVLNRATLHVAYSRTLTRLAAEIGMSSNGAYISCTDEDQDYPHNRSRHVIRIADGKLLFEDGLDDPDLPGGTIDFSPDGRFVAIGNETGFKIFELSTEKLAVESPALYPPWRPKPGPSVTTVRFGPDGAFLLIWRHGVLRRWKIGAVDGGSLPALDSNLRFTTHTVSRDCKWMSCTYNIPDGQGGLNGLAESGFAVMDLESGKAIWKWSGPKIRAADAAITPDGKIIALSEVTTRSTYIVHLPDITAGVAK